MPVVQDVVAVEGVGVGVGSPKEKNQVHSLVKVVKSGPARTSKETSSPSNLAIKEKMETCYVPPRRSWHCIGTNYGDDACQEWLSEKQLVLQEPTYPDAVLVSSSFFLLQQLLLINSNF
jgi:hypothetical protein